MRIKKILCKTVAVITTAAMLTGYSSVLDTEASEYESDSEEVSIVLEEETDSEETSENVTTEEEAEDVSEVVVEDEAKSASLMATSEDDFEYDLLDDGTIEITGYVGDDTDIVIPGTIDGYTVTAIGEEAFAECWEITSLEIPEGVTYIGDYAFEGCKITNIELPDSLTYIGIGAFKNCDSLTNITIPDGITRIYELTFESCDSLTSVTIPSSVTIIIDAFFDCVNLTDIYFDGTESEWNSISFGDDWNTGCPDDMEIHYIKPEAPTISSLSNTTSGVKVTWSKISGASGYYIYRKTGSSGTYKKIKTVTSASTVSYTDTSVSSGTTYYYYVKAYNGSVTSDYKAKSKKYLKAGKISSLTNKSSGITIKWSKVTGASGYYIYRKTSSGSYSKIKTITSGSTLSYTDTKVKSKNGTTYVYKVVPYSGSTTGSFTAKTTVRLTGTTLSSVKNSSSKKITVKWSKKSSITGYQIQYSTSSSFSSYKTVTVSGASKVSKVISSLTKNKTYYVRIRTYKTVSGTKYYSAWSSKKSVKIKK